MTRHSLIGSTRVSPLDGLHLFRHRCRACGRSFFLRGEPTRNADERAREPGGPQPLAQIRPAPPPPIPAEARDSCLADRARPEGEPSPEAIDRFFATADGGRPETKD